MFDLAPIQVALPTLTIHPGPALLLLVIVVIVLLIPILPRLSRDLRRSPEPEPDWTVIDHRGRRPLSQTEGCKLFAIVCGKNECPDCHEHGFYEGPSGGMSTNIFCKNRDCRAGFNVTPLGDGHGTAERITKGDLRRYPIQAETLA